VTRAHAFALAGALACAGGGCRGHEPPSAAPLPVRVAATRAATTGAEGARYSATLQPQSQVDLAFKVNGYVVELLEVRGADGRSRPVDVGDRVTRGAVLARVRQLDYAVPVSQVRAQVEAAQAAGIQAAAQLEEAQALRTQAAAQLAQARAPLEQAQFDFARARSLFASESLTKTDYDAAKARLDGAQAGVDSAVAQVRSADARLASAQAHVAAAEAQVQQVREQLRQTEIQLSDTILAAPMDAVVLSRKAELAALMQPGTVAFTLADTAYVKAVFGVPDSVVPTLRPGVAVRFTSVAAPTGPINGVVSTVSSAADAKTRLFDVQVSIPNPHGQLRVGAIVTASLPGAPAPANLLTVPLTAIVRPPGQPTGFAVFVVEESGGRTVARLRRVEPGAPLGDQVAVLDGLRAGERIVITGATLVADGQPVLVVP
jgi:RND family efflux transporter MFP subunit